MKLSKGSSSCFLFWKIYRSKTLFFFGAEGCWKRSIKVLIFLVSSSDRPHELKISLPVFPTHMRRYADCSSWSARFSGPLNIKVACC